MIQELLGGVMEERKISIPGSLRMDHSSSSAASSPSQSSPAAAASSPSSASGAPEQNLRCPRCDSSNTKFCYYNNYNLTQPRHFCKTCRRYWTKGGALRNVPIGGGCRKAKAAPSIAAAVARSGAGAKAKPLAASVDPLGRPARSGGLVDHDLAASAGLWASPHTSHLMALLRATSIQNPNPNPSPILKDHQDGVHAAAEPTGSLNAAGLGFDPLGQLTVGPCGSLWRSTSQYLYQQPPQMQLQSQQQSMLLAEAASSGMQELYHRLKSSSNYYSDGHLQVSMSNAGNSDASRLSSSMAAAGMAATSSPAPVLEQIPLSGGEYGYWNPALSWSDLPAANGAYP